MYRVRYQDQDGQHFTSNIVQFIEVTPLPYKLHFENHPVQADQPIVIRLGHGDDALAKLEVVDLHGRLLWSQEGLTAREVDGLTLPAGILTPNLYILRMTTSKGQLTKKLVIK